MTEKASAFHHDTGKGSRPRSYSVTQEEFKKKFDAIDWSIKAESTPETCIKCPRDTDMRCNYCGLKQSDGSVKNIAELVAAASSDGQG